MAVERALKFVDDMGVATHIDYTDGKYVEIERVL